MSATRAGPKRAAEAAEPSAPIAWVVGLRNPGAPYEGTRHNAGGQWVAELAESLSARFAEGKALGAKLAQDGELRMALPEAWMNESGKAVGAMAKRMGLKGEQLLVAHDDVELAAGQARLKFGGGYAGHNGLRSVGAALGGPGFWRLRIGVGRPAGAADGESLADWSLSKPSPSDRIAIAEAMGAALAAFEDIRRGDFAAARDKLGG